MTYANVYVTRFWHNHQPNYWPEWNGNGSENNRVQYAWDSIVLKDGQTYSTGVGHPENNLTDIFGKEDRKAAYQGRPRDSVANVNGNAGYAISYSGSLIDNVRNLANNGQMYGSDWNSGNTEARGWTTGGGSPRLDMVGFTYHHSLAAVLPKAVLRKEIQTFKQSWWKAWGGNSDLSDHSKGFFPTEMAFSHEMMDVLVDEGYEWVIVASHHLSRTCPTYNNDQGDPTGSYNIKSSPPNRADQIGPSPTSGWWFNEPNPGQASRNVSPFAYQLHKAKYINPETGAEKSMVVVPSDDTLSYQAGYSGAQVGVISGNIAPFANDSNKPVLVMPSTDGDNAWGGGFDSWMNSTPGFFSGSQGAGYNVTTPQDFVNQFGGNADYAHVENGAWIFPESAYGAPYFLKWIEPPLDVDSPTAYPGTMVDLETPGFALKFWSWSPVIAGANWCETAEQMMLDEGGSVEAWKIAAPYDWDGTYSNPNVVERGWHIYLNGLDSGFNYYGGLGNDDEVKQSLATRRAIEVLRDYVDARRSNDQTPPTIFYPQRFPWNPGGYTFGWFNSIPGGDTSYLKEMPSYFYVWTHIHDISGVQNVTLKARVDNDGFNTLSNNQNETYAGGSDVGSWQSFEMTRRVLPNTQASLNAAADNGQINYFPEALPSEIADYYFVKLDCFRGALVDYYIEAVDTRGNVRKSDIQHVYVEDDGTTPNCDGGGVDGGATFSSDPSDCAPITVTYDANGRSLSNAANVVMMTSFDNQSTWINTNMTSLGGSVWETTISAPDNAPSIIATFHNGQTGGALVWDGSNFTNTIRDCESTGPSSLTFTPDAPVGCDPVEIKYYPAEGPLQGATQINIHIGHDGWLEVIDPDPVMTQNGNYWTYTYIPPAGAGSIDVVVNDGTNWDNNTGNDWYVAINGCTNGSALEITAPSSNITVASTQTNYLLAGTANATVVGKNLIWSNALNGATGALTAVSTWTLPIAVPLDSGTNVITVRAYDNDAIIVEDTSDDAAYSSGWSGGGGNGWANDWLLSTTGSSGHFIANTNDNPSLSIGNSAFSMWANSGGQSASKRTFAASLNVGNALQFQFENGWINTGSIVGFSFLNNAGETLFAFNFTGGESSYKITDASGNNETSMEYTSDAMDINFSLTDIDEYSFDANGNNSSGFLINRSDKNITQIQIINNNAGPGDSYNVYVDQIQVQGAGNTVLASDSVTIIREGDVDTDGDGILDDWEITHFGNLTTASATTDTDLDGSLDYQEYYTGTDPNDDASVFKIALISYSGNPLITYNTVGQKSYQVEYNDDPNMLPTAWTPLTTQTEADVGSGLETTQDCTDTSGHPDHRVYRIRLLP